MRERGGVVTPQPRGDSEADVYPEIVRSDCEHSQVGGFYFVEALEIFEVGDALQDDRDIGRCSFYRGVDIAQRCIPVAAFSRAAGGTEVTLGTLRCEFDCRKECRFGIGECTAGE